MPRAIRAKPTARMESLSKRDSCRELARTAKIESTFVVWSDSGRASQERKTTDSFAEAVGLLSQGDFGSMRIEFAWQLGNSGGRGEVEYCRVTHPLATETLIRQTARNLVFQKIAAALYEKNYAAG